VSRAGYEELKKVKCLRFTPKQAQLPRSPGATCAGTIYIDKPPGNSPENAQGLGLFGFADLEHAMCLNCALACHYPYGDLHRIFGQGTP
jgi:hypothetical protein